MKKEKNPNKNQSAEYLTRIEAAAFLNLSIAKFDQLKDIDRIKYGKSVRFSIFTLREYAASHTVTNGGFDNA